MDGVALKLLVGRLFVSEAGLLYVNDYVIRVIENAFVIGKW